MATPFRIKRSAVPNKRPQLTDLELGELAFNFYDGRLFAKKDTAGVGVGTTVTLLNPWTENIGGGIYYTDGNVGIGSTIPTSKLWVQGDARFTGVSSFNNVVIDGTLGAGLTVGVVGQYLRATGTGVTWSSFPTLRTTGIVTATEGQAAFTFAYNTNFLDVFVNGVRLTPSEYVANNGTSVILNNPAFLNDVVEFVSYNTTSNTASGTGGAIILDDLTDVSLSGIPSTGQLLRYNGSFWANEAETFTRTSAGVSTTLNVGIGTTNPTRALTVKGNTSLETLNVSGVSTFGNLNVNDSTTELSSIVNIRKASGGNLTAQFDIGGQATLYYDGTQRFQTSSVGAVVNGDFTVQSNGNISAGSLTLGSVAGASGNLNISGISTLGLGTNFVTVSPTGRGRIGIGTTNPLTNLHIVGFATTATSSTSTYPVIRLEVKDTVLTDPQRYGSIEFAGNDSSSNASGVRARIDCNSWATNGQASISLNFAGGNSTTVSGGTTFRQLSVDYLQPFHTYWHTGDILNSYGGTNGYRKSQLSGDSNVNVGSTESVIDLTPYLPLANATPWTRVVEVFVAGNYHPDGAPGGSGGIGTARFMKKWINSIVWNNVTGTYSIETASITTSFSSAPTNWPATINAGVNTTGAFIRTGVSTCQLVLQSRASAGSTSIHYWVYDVIVLNA